VSARDDGALALPAARARKHRRGAEADLSSTPNEDVARGWRAQAAELRFSLALVFESFGRSRSLAGFGSSGQRQGRVSLGSHLLRERKKKLTGTTAVRPLPRDLETGGLQTRIQSARSGRDPAGVHTGIRYGRRRHVTWFGRSRLGQLYVFNWLSNEQVNCSRWDRGVSLLSWNCHFVRGCRFQRWV